MRIKATVWQSMAAVTTLFLACESARCLSRKVGDSKGFSHVYVLAADPAALCAGPCNKPRTELLFKGIVYSHVSDHISKIAILRKDGAIETYDKAAFTGKLYIKYAKLLCWYRGDLVLTSNENPLIYNPATHRVRPFPALRHAWYILPYKAESITVSDTGHGTRIDLIGRHSERRRSWTIGSWGRGEPLLVSGRFLVVNEDHSSENVTQNLKVVDVAKGTVRDLIRGEVLLGYYCDTGSSHLIVSTPGTSFHDGMADATVISEIDLITGKRERVCKVSGQFEVMGQIKGTTRFLGMNYYEAHGPGKLESIGRHGEPLRVLDPLVWDAFPAR